jgi:hypothetical protein
MPDKPAARAAPKKTPWHEYAPKLLAGLAALISSVAIPLYLHFSGEANRRATLYSQIMSERERSDTAIRADMFKALLQGYLGEFKVDKGDEDSFRRRIVFLELLLLNFHEYFQSKPLFEDIYRRLNAIDRPGNPWARTLKEDLVNIARDTVARQTQQLQRAALYRQFDIKLNETACIRLYEVGVLTDKDKQSLPSEPQIQTCAATSLGPNAPAAELKPAHRSLEVTAIDVQPSAIKLRATVVSDAFTANGQHAYSVYDEPMTFHASFFDMPYTDNTRLFNGRRFALTLDKLVIPRDPNAATARLGVLVFPEEFMTLRDRPFFEEMLQRLNAGTTP